MTVVSCIRLLFSATIISPLANAVPPTPTPTVLNEYVCFLSPGLITGTFRLRSPPKQSSNAHPRRPGRYESLPTPRWPTVFGKFAPHHMEADDFFSALLAQYNFNTHPVLSNPSPVKFRPTAGVGAQQEVTVRSRQLRIMAGKCGANRLALRNARNVHNVHLLVMDKVASRSFAMRFVCSPGLADPSTVCFRADPYGSFWGEEVLGGEDLGLIMNASSTATKNDPGGFRLWFLLSPRTV